MEETVRQDLLAKTKQALDADDWDAVVRLWQPWVQQGDPEAEYQLAYHYLWCTPCDDDATRGSMKELLKDAAAKDHPDAIWFLAGRESRHWETDPNYAQQILRAGELGSVNAHRQLGVMYATGDCPGLKISRRPCAGIGAPQRKLKPNRSTIWASCCSWAKEDQRTSQRD